MSEIKHTPKPWHDKHICDIVNYGPYAHQCFANQQLINKAPELLEALDTAIAYLANPQAFDAMELRKTWLFLKARAEGRLG